MSVPNQQPTQSSLHTNTTNQIYTLHGGESGEEEANKENQPTIQRKRHYSRDKLATYNLLFDSDSDPDDTDFIVAQSFNSPQRNVQPSTPIEDEETEDDLMFDRPITPQEISDLQIDSFFSGFTDDEDQDPDFQPPESGFELDEIHIKIPQKEISRLLEDLDDFDHMNPNTVISPRKRKKTPKKKHHHSKSDLQTSTVEISEVKPVYHKFTEEEYTRVQQQLATHYQLLLQTFSLSYLDFVLNEAPVNSIRKPMQPDQSVNVTPKADLFNITTMIAVSHPVPSNSVVPAEDNRKDSKAIASKVVAQRVLTLIADYNKKSEEHQSQMSNLSEKESILLKAVPMEIQQAGGEFIESIQKTCADDLRFKLKAVYDLYPTLWSNKEALPSLDEGFPYQKKVRSGRLNFTKSEDQLLVLGMERFGIGSWQAIRDRFLPTKTATQIQHRYKNMSAAKAPLEDNPIKSYYMSKKKDERRTPKKTLKRKSEEKSTQIKKQPKISKSMQSPPSIPINPLALHNSSLVGAPIMPLVASPFVNYPFPSLMGIGQPPPPTNNQEQVISEVRSLASLPSLSGLEFPESNNPQSEDSIQWEIEDIDSDSDEPPIPVEVLEPTKSVPPLPDNVMLVNGHKILWTQEEDRNILTASIKQPGSKEEIWTDLVKRRVIVGKDTRLIMQRYEWLIQRLIETKTGS